MKEDERTSKRVFIGGLYDTVTDEDIKQRFGRFGQITDVDIKVRFDETGKPMKTFAYVDMTTDDKNYNQCVQMYNKTKWKGAEVQIQLAKESYLDRLKREREAQEKAEAVAAQRKKLTDADKNVPVKKNDMIVKGVAPGKSVDGKKDWVVGKYGRVLPVVHIRNKSKQRVITVDPSKFCHSLKKLDHQDTKTNEKDKKVMNLVWNLNESEENPQRTAWFADIPSNGKKTKPAQNVDSKVKHLGKRRKSSGYESGTDTDSDSSQGAEVKIHSKKKKKKPAAESSDSSESDFESELPFGMERTDLTKVIPVPVPAASPPPVVDDFEVVSTAFLTKKSVNAHSSDSEDTDDMLTAIKSKKLSHEETKKHESPKKSSKSVKDIEVDASSSDSDSPVKNTSKIPVSNRRSEQKDSSDSECPDELLSRVTQRSNTSKSATTPKSESRLPDQSKKTPLKSPSKKKKLKSPPSTPANEAPVSITDDVLSLSAKLQSAVQSGDVANILELTNKLQEVVRQSGTPSTKVDTPDGMSPKVNGISSKKRDRVATVTSPVGKTPTSSKVKKMASPALCKNMDDEVTGTKTVKGKASTSESSSDEEFYAQNRSAQKKSATIINKANSSGSNNRSYPCISEFAGGLEDSGDTLRTKQQHDADSSDEDLLDLVATGKAHKLRKMAADIDKGLNKTKRGPSSQSDINNSTKKMKDKSQSSEEKLISKSVEKTKAGKSDVGTSSLSSKNKVVERTSGNKSVMGDKKKMHTADNQKRLESLRQRKEEQSSKQSIIKQALAAVDSKTSSKITFDSDEDEDYQSQPVTMEMESPASHRVQPPAAADGTSSSDEEEDETDESEEEESSSKAKKLAKASKLFDDGDTSSDEDDEEKDKERFRIRPEFEGKKGQKLINLQLSRPTSDNRFALDSRFAESDSNDEESEEDERIINEDAGEKSEKDRALEILKGVVGAKAALQPRKEKSKFKDVNTLHYDPTRDDHEEFEVKQKPESKKKSKKAKAGEAVITEPEPVPEVSKECFYEVTPSLKQVFDSGKEQTFSFAALFGGNAVEDEENTDKNRRAKNKELNEQAKAEPITTAGVLPWQQDNFVCDSSEDEEVAARQKESSTQMLDARHLSIQHQARKFLDHHGQRTKFTDTAGSSALSAASAPDHQRMFDKFLADAAYTKQEIAAIEEQTQGQVENALWFELRKGLITASSFKFFPRPVKQSLSDMDNFAELFFHPRCKSYFSDDPQQVLGRIGEEEARKIYTRKESLEHEDLVVKETGLIMCYRQPIFACSPDGIVSCACHGARVLEIKAPSALAHLSAEKAAKCRGCYEKNGEWFLDKEAAHYSQVQAQMGISGLPLCHFVIYTTDILVVSVPFDKVFYETRIDCLKKFYAGYMFSYLIEEAQRLDTPAGEMKQKASQKKTSATESCHVAATNFFFQINDPRIEEGVRSFCRPDDEGAMREKWEEERPALVEAYRMKRKRVMRSSRGRTSFQPQAKRGRRR